MIWIIPLAILAVAANATMDEIQFHWHRVFMYWFPVDKKITDWFNPVFSWSNKYWSKNKYIQWFFKVPLVFVTDFWHFLKFIMLNSIYGIITIMTIELGAGFKWYWLMIGFNLAWGFFWEFTSAVYGRLGDVKKMKLRKIEKELTKE
jgi:hypothetical protein